MTPGSKKGRERICLDKAYASISRKHGNSKRLLEGLQGVEIERTDSERPDFIIRRSDGFCLAIEHFVVDQASEELRKSPGRFTGKSILLEDKTRRVYEEYREDVLSEGIRMDELGAELASIMAETLAGQRNSTYHSFLRHFEYCVDSHLQSVEEYRRSASHYGGVPLAKVKVVFLIDMRTSFENLYINKPSGKVRRCNHGELPLFEEVVTVLEGLKGRVDFVIMVAQPNLGCANPDVIVVDCANVRKSLKSQGLRECVFAGSELAFKDSGSISSEFEVSAMSSRNEDGLTMDFECSYKQVDQDAILTSGLIGAQVAWRARKHGKKFAADIPVQIIMTQFGDSIVGWRPPNKASNETCAQPVLVGYDSADGETRMNLFQSRFFAESVDSEMEGAGR